MTPCMRHQGIGSNGIEFAFPKYWGPEGFSSDPYYTILTRVWRHNCKQRDKIGRERNRFIYTRCLRKKEVRGRELRCNFGSRNRASGAHWNTHKNTPNKHVKQEWYETNGKYLRKWVKTWIMIYFRAPNDPGIEPLRPIFNTPPKVAQIDMYTKTDAKPVENFWESNKRKPSCWLILALLGPKRDRKFGLQGPFFTHTWKYPRYAYKPSSMVPY